MARRGATQTSESLLSSLVAGLRSNATRPTIYGYKPLPHQLEFHKSKARNKLFIGGNRAGKTVGGAAEAVWWLTGTHPYRPTPPPPVRGRCVSVDFINGVEKIVRPEIARWMPASQLKGGSWETAYNKELRTLYLENGSSLEFMSMDQDIDKFAGTSRHFIWFDEEPDQAIFIENQLRLLDTGGSYWITMTPVEGFTWVHDSIYIKSRVDHNFFTIEVATDQNTHLNMGEIEALFATMSEDEREARRMGHFVQIGGLIYKGFTPKHILQPIVGSEIWESTIKKKWMHVTAMDHGFTNPTCWLWGAVSPDGKIVIYEEHYRSNLLVSGHAEAVKEVERDLGVDIAYRVGDPSIRNTDPITGTSVLLEYVENDLPIVLGNNDVRAGINRVAAKFEGQKGTPQLFVTRNCVNLIHELGRYRWGQWASKKHNYAKNKKEEPHKKDDHACDALRYFIASRPAVEDGTIPRPRIPEGYPVVNIARPIYEYDKVTLHSGSEYTKHADFNLGGEY